MAARRLVCSCACLLVASVAFAQPQSLQVAAESGGPKPTAQAVRVQERPLVDGNVLEEPAWQQAPVISGFWQEQPDEGQVAALGAAVIIAWART